MDYKLVKACRICGSKRLSKYLDLGTVPLPNNLSTPKDLNHRTYPIEVLLCQSCSLSQLSVVVKPNLMYSEYSYHSSVSKTFQAHCLKLAKHLKKDFNGFNARKKLALSELWGKNRESISKLKWYANVMDIASNDGCLLREFRKVGYGCLGVEPAKNLNNDFEGSPVIREFWSYKSAKNIKARFDFITATNVFAHVDDVKDFLAGVKEVLYDTGVFVMEVPYLYDLIFKNQFDTIYHEHLSYFLIKPLIALFESCGLNLFKVERINIHGGSIRVYASKDNRSIHHSVHDLGDFEGREGMYEFDTYSAFSTRVEKLREDLRLLLEDLFSNGYKVIGYGASAKGISLLNYCSINNYLLPIIVDDTPYKQNKFTPGSLIPIKDSSVFSTFKPDYIVLLAWNFSKELMAKTKWHKGSYIVPVPEVKII